MGMSPHSIPIALTGGASQVVSAIPTRYKGIVVRETAGGAMVLRLWNNPAAASGTLIDVISLAANGVASITIPDDGVACSTGLFLERVSGTTYEGSVRLG